MDITRGDVPTRDGSAEVVSLQRERTRRRIRRRLLELREAREKYESDPAAEERSRRINEIAEIAIEEVLGSGWTS